MRKNAVTALLCLATFCAKAQTIEFVNSTGNGRLYTLAVEEYAPNNAKTTTDVFGLRSTAPNISHIRQLKDRHYYFFSKKGFVVGELLFVTVMEKKTGAVKYKYWRSFDNEQWYFSTNATEIVTILVVNDPKNPQN